uniref:Uncharacterized protein n=1 Tax=Salix viminalis TaxID=40686 RepID=A0A6N2KY39_SALVM
MSLKILCNAPPSREIYIPFEGLGPVNLGQAPNNRPILALFGGRFHEYIREVVFKPLKDQLD